MTKYVGKFSFEIPSNSREKCKIILGGNFLLHPVVRSQEWYLYWKRSRNRSRFR